MQACIQYQLEEEIKLGAYITSSSNHRSEVVWYLLESKLPQPRGCNILTVQSMTYSIQKEAQAEELCGLHASLSEYNKRGSLG